MQWLLVFFYSAIICWGISRMKFFKDSGVKIHWWIAIFLVKVLVGILYGYIHSFSYGGGDTYYGFKQGVRIYDAIYNNGLSVYLKLVFLPCHYPAYEGLERWAHNSIPYGDESYYLIIRFHALVALISGGYYNVHVVFFNILSFTGVAFLYSAFKDELKEKRFLILASLLLIPSVVFWTSGIHKDGLSLLGIGMILYSVKKRIKYSGENIIAGILGILLLYIVRSYILLILFPLVFVYIIFEKKKNKLIVFYGSTFIAFILFILLVSSLTTTVSPFSKLIWWQSAFKAIPATENTISLPSLQPKAASFFEIIPVSINHSFLQPLPWKAINFYQFVIGMQEMILFFLLVLLIFYSIIKRQVFSHLFYLSLGYTISLYALLGIIVPNLGALSRYKSTGTFFLALAIICLLPYEKSKNI